MLALVAVLASGLFGGSGPTYFELSAQYEAPAKGQSQGAILVRFLQTEAGVHVNEKPAPRLTLDPSQTTLDYKAPSGSTSAAAAAPAKPLDLSQPVRFPVTLRAAVPSGDHSVSANVTYFYCSEREGWCRRGTQDLAVTVHVP